MHLWLLYYIYRNNYLYVQMLVDVYTHIGPYIQAYLMPGLGVLCVCM
jgi:hypothetical protein